MSIDVARHGRHLALFRERQYQDQQQDEDNDAAVGSSSARRRLQAASADRIWPAISDLHAKCTCHDACNDREQQLAREIEKLREALEALKRESDKEMAFLKDQLVAAASASLTTSKSPVRAPIRPTASADCCGTASPAIPVTVLAVPRATASTATGTSAPTALAPMLYAVAETGGSTPYGPLARVATDNSSRKALTTAALQSIADRASLASVAVAERVLAAFAPPLPSSPHERDLQPNAAYFYSLAFCDDIAELSALASATLQSEPRCLSLSSPTYVLGDLHGNLRDLSFFSSRIWQPLGVSLSAGTLLFLGDYVDRGAMSLEVVAYLLALKALHPRKVFLLRGNHETRAVNGLEEVYGGACLLAQCRARFGDARGRQLWEQLNCAFDRLPLAATIDNDVFCVHGGIPRPPASTWSTPAAVTLADIRRLPAVAPLDALPSSSGVKPQVSSSRPSPSREEKQLAMIAELLWGDPVRGSGADGDDEDAVGLDALGFGRSARGGAAVTFGARAVDDFLALNGLSRVLRAHEAAVEGVSLSQSARVVTLFSTSADHGLGAHATCAGVLVENQQIRVFNRARPRLAPAPLQHEREEHGGGSEGHRVRQRRWSVTLGQPGQHARGCRRPYQQLYQETARVPAASMVMDRIPGGRAASQAAASGTDDDTDDDEHEHDAANDEDGNVQAEADQSRPRDGEDARHEEDNDNNQADDD